MEFFRKLIDLLTHLGEDDRWRAMVDYLGVNTLYAVLFMIVFCETGLVVTPFLPGDSLIFAIGAVAAREIGLSLGIVGPLLIKNHRILHAGATPLLDIDAQGLARVLSFAQHRFDFLSRARREAHNRFRDRIHIHINFRKKLNRDLKCCQIAETELWQTQLTKVGGNGFSRQLGIAGRCSCALLIRLSNEALRAGNKSFSRW